MLNTSCAQILPGEFISLLMIGFIIIGAFGMLLGNTRQIRKRALQVLLLGIVLLATVPLVTDRSARTDTIKEWRDQIFRITKQFVFGGRG